MLFDAEIVNGSFPKSGPMNRFLAVISLSSVSVALFNGCLASNAFLDSGVGLVFNVATSPGFSTTGDAVLESGVVFESIDGRIGSHAPTIAALPDGELLAAWYSYSGPGELDDSAIFTARRPPGQTEWSAPVLHLDRAEPEGNPVLYCEGHSVWLFSAVAPLGWSTARIEWQHSTDRGATWTLPAAVDGPLGSNVRYPPVRTADGELLLPAYDDLLLRSLFFASGDGFSWALRSHVTTDQPHANLQPSMARLASGRLLAVMRNTGQEFLWAMASDDSGRTWSPPINAAFANPASPAALLMLQSGRLLLIFNDSATQRRPLSATLSDDEGQTWLSPRVVMDGQGDFAYPAAVQTGDGLIHIVYSNNRANIGHVTINEAWLALSQ